MLEDAFHSFLSHYKQNEMFDLHMHGTGPGLVGVVVHSLKTYLGQFIDTKLNRQLPVQVNRKCTLEVYMNKLKEICAKVVCDREEEGTDECGRLKKMVEEGAKLTKGKMKKPNVKYTERKPTAPTSRGMDKATVSTDEESGEESCSSGEENFSTLTSYDIQEQYRPPDKTRKEARFGAKRQEPAAEDSIQFTMWSLKDKFSKITKKLSEQEMLIQKLKLSNAAKKKKLLELGDVPGVVSTTKKKNVLKEGRLGIKLLQDCDEWAISNQGFMLAELSNLKGFVSTQLRHEIEGTDDIVVLDDPDSTTSGTKMKKKKKTTKRLEESDKDSNASEVLSRSQRPKKRHHISSNRSSALYELPSPNAQQSGEETGDEVNRLLNERDEVAEKLLAMQRKMEGLEWAERVRVYKDTIEKSVVLFRLALLNNFDNKEGQEVVNA